LSVIAPLLGSGPVWLPSKGVCAMQSAKGKTTYAIMISSQMLAASSASKRMGTLW
jgi:hypothetical protein